MKEFITRNILLQEITITDCHKGYHTRKGSAEMIGVPEMVNTDIVSFKNVWLFKDRVIPVYCGMHNIC